MNRLFDSSFGVDRKCEGHIRVRVVERDNVGETLDIARLAQDMHRGNGILGHATPDELGKGEHPQGHA